MPTVVIAPFNVVNHPEGSGHFWVYLQYALGLRKLGCEVYWLEGFRAAGHAEKKAAALATFHARMEQFGLGRNVVLYLMRNNKPSAKAPTEYVNMTRDEAEAIFQRADLLLNFHYAISPGLLARFRRTALVDIDPGLLQFWMTRGQLNVPHHDIYFTTGETISETTSGLPNDGARWTYFRPPVCLEHWPYAFNPYSRAFTTVSNWDASDWVVDDDQRYENTKRVAFLEFADLPRLTSQPLELALFLKRERDFAEQREMERRGWHVRPSREVAATPQMYAAYIRGSRGEFSCAKRSC